MTNQTWRVARLAVEIERRDRDIPVREHLGIHAFGINAYTPGEDGILIGEHDETGSGPGGAVHRARRDGGLRDRRLFASVVVSTFDEPNRWVTLPHADPRHREPPLRVGSASAEAAND